MTAKTLLKAKTIYKAGGVERTGVRIYRVTSTSGETYGVVLAERAVCTCPAMIMCSHIAAAEIFRAKRAAEPPGRGYPYRKPRPLTMRGLVGKTDKTQKADQCRG